MNDVLHDIYSDCNGEVVTHASLGCLNRSIIDRSLAIPTECSLLSSCSLVSTATPLPHHSLPTTRPLQTTPTTMRRRTHAGIARCNRSSRMSTTVTMATLLCLCVSGRSPPGAAQRGQDAAQPDTDDPAVHHGRRERYVDASDGRTYLLCRTLSAYEPPPTHTATHCWVVCVQTVNDPRPAACVQGSCPRTMTS